MFSLKFTHSPAGISQTRETTCELFYEGESIGKGYAVCAPSDNFNKATGRKLSLARALDDAALLRKHRAQVWDLYLAKWGYRGCSSFGR